MKRIYKIIAFLMLSFLLVGFKAYSQQDTMYIYSQGSIIFKIHINNIDSLKFSDTPPLSLKIYTSNAIVFEKFISEIDSILFYDVTTLYKRATVSTKTVSDITDTSATLGGNITFIGFPEYIEKGICYSTSPNPTINDSTLIVAGNGIGEYTINTNRLTSNTIYYVRAYAINDLGIAYGDEINFTTLADSIACLTTL